MWEVYNDVLAKKFWLVVGVLCALDFVLALAVFRIISFTDIDITTYFFQIQTLLRGNLDYRELTGPTGPLVYPSGHVVAYTVLYFVTDGGTKIRRAQLIFCVLHALCFATVAAIYYLYASDQPPKGRRSFPLACIVILLASRRVMSLFVLRLFNDAIQAVLVYFSIALLARNYWTAGCLAFSASVAIKMNALLYAPALALVLCQALGPLRAFVHIVVVCGGLQLLLGAPFLWYAPGSYISKAFEFSRVFMYKWSVNGAFLPEHVFVDKRLAVALLVGHLFTLLIFGHFRWTAAGSGGLVGLVSVRHPESRLWLVGREWWDWASRYRVRRLRRSHVIHCMFSCNLIGIAFARTLHYQFYLWYFHTLPLLVFSSALPTPVCFAVLLAIELVFNIYPPRGVAALALCVSHFAALSGLWGLPPKNDCDIFGSTPSKASKRGEKNF
jgi:alpha-1,3-mannosyltransferase